MWHSLSKRGTLLAFFAEPHNKKGPWQEHKGETELMQMEIAALPEQIADLS